MSAAMTWHLLEPNRLQLSLPSLPTYSCQVCQGQNLSAIVVAKFAKVRIYLPSLPTSQTLPSLRINHVCQNTSALLHFLVVFVCYVSEHLSGSQVQHRWPSSVLRVRVADRRRTCRRGRVGGSGLHQSGVSSQYFDAFLSKRASLSHLLGKAFCWFRQPTRSFCGGENCFFWRTIFDQFWLSTAPTVRFLAVSRSFSCGFTLFLAPARPLISATLSWREPKKGFPYWRQLAYSCGFFDLTADFCTPMNEMDVHD